jgi:cyclic pyranopterin phosphate synthase
MAKKQRELPHLDELGQARMVDVGAKPETVRRAVAEGFVRLSKGSLAALEDGAIAKGDALAVARIAGLTAAKRAWELIPLAHPIGLTHAAVELTLDRRAGGVRIEARCESVGRTGVEMEAMTAVSVAALSLYDMIKAKERGATIESVRLLEKSGGKSGTWRRNATSR